MPPEIETEPGQNTANSEENSAENPEEASTEETSTEE